MATEGYEELVHERLGASCLVARRVEGETQRLVDQILVLRLLGRLQEQRRVRGCVLRLVLGNGFDVAGVGHDRRPAF